MGGIEADIDGRTKVEISGPRARWRATPCTAPTGWGGNSTAECLVWGDITGRGIRQYLGPGVKLDAAPEGKRREEEKRIFDGLLQRNGPENPAHIRRELRTLMESARGCLSPPRIDAGGLDKNRTSCAGASKISRWQDKSRHLNST